MSLPGRALPFAIAIGAIAATAAALGALAWVLRLDRVDSFVAVFVLAVGAIAWRFGRGPAIAATLAFVVISDYFFLSSKASLGPLTLGDSVGLVIGILGAAALIQFGHVSRRRTIELEKRRDLLQDVSPRILQNLDSEAIMNTVAEATLRVIDYQHLRLYRWDESAERLVLVKSVARAAPYAAIDWHSMTLALGEGITGIAAKTCKPLLVPDASRDQRMVYPAETTPIEESVLSVPMVTRDRLFGVLSLARLGARSLSTEDLRLMESIAAQTALALANAEEHAEAEQTIKALAMIESLQPADEAVPEAEAQAERRILQSFIDLSLADLATLRIQRKDGRYHVVASGGRQWPERDVPMGPPLRPADVGWLADSRTTVYVADPRTDSKLPEWAQRGTELAGVKATIFLPIRAGQRLVGFVGLHWRRPRWFRPEQLGRLQLLAAQVAIAFDTREALERERSRADALAELERARREFMQIASHELRTPLTVIRGYASMLEDGTLGELPPRARQALQTLLEKTGEMRVQVERMLLLARLEDAATPPQMMALDFRAVVEEAIARVRAAVALRQGEVDVDLTAGPMPVVGDRERLSTALDNLLQNAVKFSSGPPRIEVAGGRVNGRVHLVVRDHGIGIPEAARRHLFEKFYRVNDPSLQNVAGTGIGLYLVRQVVEGHGGRVEVESQPGPGSAFRIELPADAG
ncbi:MAG TPA: GAF domain-containing protein [Candidatus Dormibacteraeota bacterium]|nr:GAF domain-containing protein [Candidatus Dormibacteraeota bacterium]